VTALFAIFVVTCYDSSRNLKGLHIRTFYWTWKNRYCTAGVDKRVRSTSFNHSRQSSILILILILY